MRAKPITFRSFMLALCVDDRGKVSQSKVITLVVAFAATVFMWKLVLLGGMSVDFFIAYLACGSGHGLLSKFIDTKDTNRQQVETRQP